MSKRRLKDRRTIIVRFYTLLSVLVLSVVCGGAVYGIWRPEVRVQNISVSGAEVLVPRNIGTVVEEALAGSHFFIFPKDSIFFVSENDIGNTLKETFPRIRTVSVSRLNFTSIDVFVSEREGSFMWCSGATSTPCTISDDEGFLFAPADTNLTPVYGPLSFDAPAIRNTIFKEGALPMVSSLVDALKTLDIEVSSITFREPDEVVLSLPSGARIEYVLGDEAHIAEAFPSVLSSIDDISEIEYIDMRFGKRVYIKRNE